MAHAYTPGLSVKARTRIRRERRLPLRGTVLKQRGDRVRPDDVLARTELPGAVHVVNIANKLGIVPRDLPGTLTVTPGAPIAAGDVIARNAGLFGLFKSEVTSPVSGTLESASEVTGQAILREPPVPVELPAYLDGEVVDVFEGEGAVVETEGCFVQGIFGLGGETFGTLRPLTTAPDAVLDADDIPDDLTGTVAIGGALMTAAAIRRAAEAGARAVVVGGVAYSDVSILLGYDLGVAITGTETLGVTVIVTEGFGRIAMAERTFALLNDHAGRTASVNGATQIRAGVIRPEIIIPITADGTPKDAAGPVEGLTVGMMVRAIRNPYFGRLGRVTALPDRLQALDTEAHVRVLELEFPDGRRAIIPRANVEIIQQ